MPELSDAEVFSAPAAAPVAMRPLPNLPGYVSDPAYTPPQGQADNPTWQAPKVPLGGAGQGREMSDDQVFGAPEAAATPAEAGAGRIPLLSDFADTVGGAWSGLTHDIQQYGKAQSQPLDQGDWRSYVPGLNAHDKALGSLIGSAANVVASPITGVINAAIVQPGARALDNLPTYEPSHITLGPQGLGATAPRRLGADEAHAGHVSDISTALSAASPAGRLAGVPLKPVDLPQLQADKTAAYQAVDRLGVAYRAPAIGSLADDLQATVMAEGGPEVYPKAALAAKHVATAASRGDMPFSTLDKLRAQVWEIASDGSDGDKRIGKILRGKIDAFMDAADPATIASGNGQDAAAAIKTARDLNTRYRKVQDVTDRLESADLRTGTTDSGGNGINTARQKLRPLIDPKSPQRMTNLTPDEAQALRNVVKGTPAQNATRYASKVLTNRIVQSALAIPTHGASFLAEIPGAALRKLGEHQAGRALDDVVRIMGNGGTKAVPPSTVRPAAGSIPMRSARGIAGAAVVIQPHLPKRAAQSSPENAAAGPRKRRTQP